MITYSDFPPEVVADIARLRRRIQASSLPQKVTDQNLLVATWNIRSFSSIFPAWAENPSSPKRNLRAMACIAEIVRRFDLVAVQEVRRDSSGLRMLMEDFLGPDWGLVLSDVTAGEAGNSERLAFIFDRRRLQTSGLAGELVLPPNEMGNPQIQFARTPYLVGFRANGQRFCLLTAHIDYGHGPEERLPEIHSLASFTAGEIRDRATTPGSEEQNLIVLGDFNIERRGDNPLFNAFVSGGLMVPPQIIGLSTTYSRTEPKHYDQIGWFMDENFQLKYTERAGTVDFTGAVFQEISPFLMSFRLSDHFPLWVEFQLDRSAETMVRTLGLDAIHASQPDPLSVVPD
jgi:endonuclease/exonuclease/phosphatase family metal-dependent hydrolase